MKKLEKSSELLWLLGVILVAFGVAICSKADLGVSMIAAPAFVVQEAIFPLLGFSVGMTEYLIQGVLLIILCIVVRRLNFRYLLAFAVAVIYGYVLDLFLFILSGIEFNTVILRFVGLIVGDVITAFGVACFFRTYLPLQVYELFVAELADRFRFPIHKVKQFFDLSLLVISAALAFLLFGDANTLDLSQILTQSYHSIGIGTLITTVINAPIINAAGKLLDRIFGTKALFPKVEQFLKPNAD